MKILVLSDSHFALDFMRECIEKVKPDCIIHLGDMFSDGAAMANENPETRIFQVPGNCDMYRCPTNEPEILVTTIGGVCFYMTHGHKHHVKSYTDLLLRDARKCCAAVVLYGHTHMDECYRESDGLWVMNPGSCGYYGGTAGLIEVEDQKIKSCRIIRRGRMEDFE